MVDVLRVTSNNTLIDTYNQVDTSGSGAWGGSTFQNEIPNVGGSPVIEPQTLVALTGNQYYLPIKNKPQDAAGNQYFNENDILLIDTDDSGVHYIQNLLRLFHCQELVLLHTIL